MIDENFIWIGVLISFAGAGGYAWETINGRTQPNRVTWFVWSFAGWIAFAAQLSKGVGIEAALTFTLAAIPMMIFVASFMNPISYWKLGQTDLICAALAVVALILWALTSEGNIAIAMSIVVDAFAGLPTIIKVIRHPRTESWTAYATGALCALLTLLVIDNFTFASAAFATYFFIISTVLTLLTVRRTTPDEPAVREQPRVIDADLRRAFAKHVTIPLHARALVATICNLIADSVVLKPLDTPDEVVDLVARSSERGLLLASVPSRRLRSSAELINLISVMQLRGARAIVIGLMHPNQSRLDIEEVWRVCFAQGIVLHVFYSTEELLDIGESWMFDFPGVGHSLRSGYATALAALHAGEEDLESWLALLSETPAQAPWVAITGKRSHAPL